MMKMHEVKKLFGAKIFPYGNRYLDEKFIEVNININILKEDSKLRDPSKIPEYKSILIKQGYMDPIWVMFGRKMRDGRICPFKEPKIKDGNHRTRANKLLGNKVINAIMPESQYKYYKENY